MSIRSLIILLFLIGILPGQKNHIYIALEDLPQLLEQSSPQLKMMNAEKELVIAAHDAGLQWTNPELNYEYEEVKMGDAVISENMLFISKSFDLPWNYWKESKILEADTIAAHLDLQLNMKQLLSEMRYDYVRIGLFQELTDQLSEIKQILHELNASVEVREMEGALSPLESSLLSMGLFGLESDILETQVEYNLAMNRWKQNMGIKSSDHVRLTDSIKFKEISLDLSLEEHLVQNHPGMRAHNFRLDALERRVSLEKGRLLPNVSLSGGYKKINDGWEGFIVGMSMPLPLLNWNQPQVETQKIEHQNQLIRSITYKQELHYKFEILVSNISLKANLLKKNSTGFHNLKIVQDMLIAYQEGSLSIPDFLNAIQIYRGISRQYFEQLSNYYRSVFDLEALSGQQLVTF